MKSHFTQYASHEHEKFWESEKGSGAYTYR